MLIRKYCELHPDEIFTILSANPDLPFADSLIIIGGKRISANYTIMHPEISCLPTGSETARIP